MLAFNYIRNFKIETIFRGHMMLAFNYAIYFKIETILLIKVFRFKG